jgi:hypothetical protein
VKKLPSRWWYLSAAVGVVAGYLHSEWFERIAHQGPKVPNPSTGSIFKIYDHGAVGYASRSEYMTLQEISATDPARREEFERIWGNPIMRAALLVLVGLVLSVAVFFVVLD